MLPHDPGRPRSALLFLETTAPVSIRDDSPRTIDTDSYSQVPNEDDDGDHQAEESYLANLDTQQEEDYDVTQEDDEDGVDDVDDEGDTKATDDGEQEGEDVGEDDESSFDASATGLKEISNLACFTVSSYKPGCGVKELRSDDMNQYWQSDGPQPHRLNIHFIKRVEIRVLRLFLDYELDESYTPTKIQITAGFGPNQTIPFSTLELTMPKGWIDVPIAGAGGGPDGNSLCCWFIRIIILENHQNGKDTHLRGVKVYALDDSADTAENNPVDDIGEAIDEYRERMTLMNIHDHDEDAVSNRDGDVRKRRAAAKKYAPGDGGLSVPDFMREPEIR
ncbi:anaphase-promoting complex, subunit 10-domain-containing protein [Microdochium trichocladiopsis]|uniref:Anaphase-promoting complex, subunit 10-domain-containing protein n=1 Tax=Microdochium trichocladiopsis TaxID=1682393 RepID=A0A9P9BU49_9PEZI|nr:anaphase-promoting complex, subunit 10-domain-containing protein [Microdochium trichocladiopsis]KAH7040646.1 anaphase-promoting complex, subunit 10-domain-containing protein [Microdochium trichocladiopsis]